MIWLKPTGMTKLKLTSLILLHFVIISVQCPGVVKYQLAFITAIKAFISMYDTSLFAYFLSQRHRAPNAKTSVKKNRIFISDPMWQIRALPPLLMVR